MILMHLCTGQEWYCRKESQKQFLSTLFRKQCSIPESTGIMSHSKTSHCPRHQLTRYINTTQGAYEVGNIV